MVINDAAYLVHTVPALITVVTSSIVIVVVQVIPFS
jgi:hypothetical protein